jgi:hypothetical protein
MGLLRAKWRQTLLPQLLHNQPHGCARAHLSRPLPAIFQQRKEKTEAVMSRDFDLESVVAQIVSTALATSFYGAMIFGLFKIASGA